ncbi:fimbria/pilus outer membrane usher protein [Erwinia tasmaniensis]|uniref:Outer membrane usher protein, fimbrial-like n=1 Tax=Erwinia tasmaniensis (strain DSM 17950 / CFBP 7177 / CIP 109463 / NCPPB 4357 / Et1/99) TaxID=465817 RepID=B2VL03_ERWT9|nr:fimbria/pilus outer membrane usher protein [Erwinia tasmaniensis]CAO97925.1 Outer membrane usher protein, fimbrial-like [Erwinia tasmaniensis Et1/99]
MFQLQIPGVILGATMLLMLMVSVRAELYFPPGLVADDEASIADLSLFEKQGMQLPGSYEVEIWLNGNPVTSQRLRFVAAQREGDKKDVAEITEGKTVRDSTGLTACLTGRDMIAFGVNLQRYPLPALQGEDSCLSPGTFIPQAWTAFDFRKMRLEVSIPQIALHNSARGDIPTERWDEGVSAAMLSYSLNGTDSRGHYGNSRSHFLNLNGGINLGPWRLRDRRNWSEYRSRNRNEQRWQHGTTILSRAIIPWRSELTLGDDTSSGDVFDSFAFRGARLASDDSMLPESLRGYAPVIRGTAGSNARISIKQNGYEVYQATVGAGEFVISDLFPMYASGDLLVTVTEVDGSARSFSVPYSSVPVLVRQGRTRYDLTLGSYRSSGQGYSQPRVMQGTLVHGLPWGLTAYGGVQYADSYRAAVLGAGVNMGVLGALSADITHADSTLSDGSQHRGQSLRFLYARSLNALGTTFQLTGYRYSTRGFYTLSETTLKRMSGWHYNDERLDTQGQPLPPRETDFYSLYDSKRQRLQASISQQIGSFGSLYLSGSQQSFWNRSGVTRSVQAGFSSTLGSLSYTLSLSQNRNAGMDRADSSVSFFVSLPLSQWMPAGTPSIYATFNESRNSDGAISQQAGLSGTLLDAGNLNWNLMQGRSRGDTSSSARMSYRGALADVGMGYSSSSNYRQLNYDAAGSVVLHRDGLTVSQPLGDTNILVAAPGAAGVKLENGNGLQTDGRGYAIRPWASGYRENRVALDVSTLDDRTELEGAVMQVVPTRGALVRADFKTRSGVRALFTLTFDGKPVPFGAQVSSGDSSGIVSDEGQVYLAGLAEEGELTVRWGGGAHQQCTLSYRIPQDKQQAPLAQMQAVCRQLNAVPVSTINH